jgi:transposase
VIPDFSSKKVSKKELRLNPLVKRVLGKTSHYRMRERLKNKCEEYSSQYIKGDESYTSQTCGFCGHVSKTAINPRTRMYSCSKCELDIDRDLNGARNILLKNHELVFR